MAYKEKIWVILLKRFNLFCQIINLYHKIVIIKLIKKLVGLIKSSLPLVNSELLILCNNQTSLKMLLTSWKYNTYLAFETNASVYIAYNHIAQLLPQAVKKVIKVSIH